jgi:flagellum-specific peptidoglycan hydrolase FlgJ
MTKEDKPAKVIVVNKVKVIEKVTEFSVDELKNTLIRFNIKFPHIVFAQAVLESGEFKSKLFIENNNMFGMKIAKQRPTTAKGSESNYAKYDNWMMSVLDYALFQSAFLRKIKTEEAYYRYLSSNYAEDPGYVSKLKQIAEKYK